MKLFPHQMDGVTYLREKRYAILGDGMGLGKTVTALAALESQRAVVVTPAALKEIWAMELSAKFPHLSFEILSSRSRIQDFNKILIVNYEIISNFPLLFKNAHTVIADEAHYLKNMKSKRTKNFLSFIKKHRPQCLFLLTGTPIKNHVPEIYSLLVLCSFVPDSTNGISVKDEYPNQTRFNDALCFVRTKRIGGMMLQEWYGLKDVARLEELLRGKYIARRLEDVVNLPPLEEHFAPVAKISRDLELRDAFQKYQTGRSVPSPVKVQTAIEKVQFTVPLVKRLLKENPGESFVIFSDHTEPVRLIHAALNQDDDVGYITGSVPIPKRNELISNFQHGVIEVLVCTIGSAGTGVTLTASTTVIFNDCPWVPGDLAQAKKRIHRIGQTHPCAVYFVTAPGFDTRIMETLNQKSKIISEALGYGS